MKIIIVGSSRNWGLPMIFKRAFCDFGHEVENFDSWNLYRSNLLTNCKITHRLFWRFLASSVQKKLIRQIEKDAPELVLIFKGWLIKPSTLRKIKSRFPNVKIFNLNGDNPFNTWHHGNSNFWIRKSIPLCDCYFIWGKFLIPKLEKAGAKMVEYLPFGCDPKLHYPVKVTSSEKKFYGSDVSFIGSWDKEREEWVSYLLDYNLKIWGNHWEKASKKVQDKWTKKEVIGEEYSKVINASKINLNFIRKQNRTAHNMRTFEIPACGGFMLSNRTPEQKEFFEEGKEAAYFDSPKELKEKIDYYLSHPKQRRKIAEEGYKKATNYEYSYNARAEKVLEVYNSIK